MAQKMTVRQFLDLILKTEISEARGWVEMFKKNEVPANLWEFFCGQPADDNTVDNIAFGISRQMSFWLRDVKDNEIRAEMLKKARRFLREMWERATENDIGVKLEYLDQIFEPKQAGV